MDLDIYSVRLSPADYAIRTALAVTPLALLTIVSRRMGRGWLLMSLPWLLLGAAVGIYAAPAIKFSQSQGGNTLWLTLFHLVAEAAPISLFVTLVVLAVVGARRASSKAESA